MIQRIASGSAYEPQVGYCRTVVGGGWIFISGTTGTDHADGRLPERIEEQCAVALDRIGVALAAAGAAFADVVRVTYILPDRRDFEACWPRLRAAFGDAPPAATMIEAGLIDPAMKIEIEVTALIPEAA